MTKKQRKAEFLENRTSWKWFDKNLDNGRQLNEQQKDRLQIEILKELQFMNDKSNA